jgi:serine kinase of HPr protein (carbohydrate metabolism regulator)
MAANMHASAVVVGDRGVLISGASGLGKTGLALALVMYAHSIGWFGCLVGDDQLLLSAHDGRLFCETPETLAGLVEVRGLGPRPIVHEAKAPVDLHVALVDRRDAQRFQEPGTELLAGCRIPFLKLAGGDHQAALRAVASFLALPPFSRGRLTI